MTFREDAKKQLKEIDGRIDTISSFAFETIDTAKRGIKLWFVTWIITFLCLIASLIYIVYLHNDIGTVSEDKVIDIDNVDSIDKSNIEIGDNGWERLD
jgi:hypothetical protein